MLSVAVPSTVPPSCSGCWALGVGTGVPGLGRLLLVRPGSCCCVGPGGVVLRLLCAKAAPVVSARIIRMENTRRFILSSPLQSCRFWFLLCGARAGLLRLLKGRRVGG